MYRSTSRGRYYGGGDGSGLVVVIGLVFLAAIAGLAALFVLGQTNAQVNQRPVHYVAYVTKEKLDQTTNYNDGNILKDGILIGGLALGAVACASGTFGACAAAAIPGVSSLLTGMLRDPIMTTSADFAFTNSGNGTATSVGYLVGTYVDSNLVNAETYSTGSIAPGVTQDVHYTYTVTLAQIPTAVWNSLQGKGSIDIEVTNLTYGGGA